MVSGMRTDRYRTHKYSRKVRGLVIPGQNSHFTSAVPRQVEIENIVNTLTGPDINRVYYIIFAKEVNKLLSKYKDTTLESELQVIQDKWCARGLNSTLLNRIKDAIGYVPVFHPFRLDFSELDGNDRLS